MSRVFFDVGNTLFELCLIFFDVGDGVDGGGIVKGGFSSSEESKRPWSLTGEIGS